MIEDGIGLFGGVSAQLREPFGAAVLAAGLVCLGLLSPLLYAAATVLPLAAGLLRRLIRLIGGSR